MIVNDQCVSDTVVSELPIEKKHIHSLLRTVILPLEEVRRIGKVPVSVKETNYFIKFYGGHEKKASNLCGTIGVLGTFGTFGTFVTFIEAAKRRGGMGDNLGSITDRSPRWVSSLREGSKRQ